jgi:transcriptional regulator
MYIRPVHAELDPAVLYQFIRSYPLGLFTSAIPLTGHPTIQTSHLPWVLDTPATPDQPARLRGHIARANPQAKALISARDEVSGMLSEEVLILFNAPVNHYVSPKFYTTTKPDTGKVVPTWNYAAVQVYGKARIHDSGPEAAEYLQSQIETLSEEQEKRQGYEHTWKVSDAPDKYVNLLKKAIVGIEIEVTKIEGRWKMSQELGDGDWQGVVDGFRALGTRQGEEMASIIKSRGKGRSESANL